MNENTTVHLPTNSRPRIVIIGGGFAGIKLARGLRRLDADILLIDKNNYHTFLPLLYQVATAALEPDSVAYPFREILKGQSNLSFRMAEVKEILPDENKIRTSIGEIGFDYLIIACGSSTTYFGMNEFAKHVLPMKTIPEASLIRNLMLENMEKALLVKDLDQQEALMNIVIIGGGPTGVELAGSIGELKLHILPHDYPELDLKKMQIHVVDMADRLLSGMSVDSSASAARSLKKFDVNLWLKTKVLSYDGKILHLSNGKKIATDTVIWAAGVAGSVISGLKEESLVSNRYRVDSFNRVEGYDRIFAVGDVACMVSPKFPKGHPMVAPVAIQQAAQLIDNFTKIFAHKPLTAFVYKNPGIMATIGRNQAVVDFKMLRFSGILAWVIWLFVHLMALVGFRNKIVVFVNWAWNYFSYDRGLRLIIRSPR